MLDTLIAIAVTVAVLAVLVPLGLCYLFTRQVAPIRPLRMMLLVIGFTLAGGPIGLVLGILLATVLQRRWRADRERATTRHAPPAGLRRPWASLVTDATTAAARFHDVIDGVAEGPLRDSLRSATVEVGEAVAEAHRLAERGDRTERAHRDVLAALDAQRRRRRRSPALTADLERSLQDATRAQHESAERLAVSARRDLSQLQLVVARLAELTAHALDLSATAGARAVLPADLSVVDRLAALRLATEEVDQAARV